MEIEAIRSVKSAAAKWKDISFLVGYSAFQFKVSHNLYKRT